MSTSIGIEQLIPHRPPMRFIETLTECTETTAIATACFSETDFGVADGGVLETALVECVAQTVAAAQGQRAQTGHRPFTAVANGMLIAVSNFKIHARPPAGKTLQIEVRETRRLGPMLLVAGIITCEGQVMAEGELSLYA
jgi:predicted hotdog family 3-hydroxylacyl-ACP dehydratase